MIDERFLIHRLKSTSLAGVAGGVAMGCWFGYCYFVDGVQRWDLLAILILMAVVKWGAMLYFHKRD
jgi:hypothetical protein